MKAGDHVIHVTVKDKCGNKREEDHHVIVPDTVAPIIDSITATASNVSMKYHDPSPSSGIVSVVVTVDGVKLNCDASGTGCDSDHDGYDENHDGCDSDHDGSDMELHGSYEDLLATPRVTLARQALAASAGRCGRT